jgi:hypothetical protein
MEFWLLKIYKIAAVRTLCNIVVIMMDGTALLSNCVVCVGYYECLWCYILLNMYLYVNHMRSVVLIE